MKSAERQRALDLVRRGLVALLEGPLMKPDSLVLAAGKEPRGPLRRGFHAHDAWELFCPLHGHLRFEVAGCSIQTVRQGALLIVPPGCMHMDVNSLAQASRLEMLVMILPGQESNYGALSIVGSRGNNTSSLGKEELAVWTTLAGDTPAAVMTRVAQGLQEGPWGYERARGFLRALLAAYAEIATGSRSVRRMGGERRVAGALAYLHTNYYDPTLSLARTAAAVGLSVSHLSTLFRRVMQRTIYQTLIDIRLQRAMDLLAHGGHTIKEVSALTGWSNQLYFSAGFRRRYGQPPSAFRSGSGTRPPVENPLPATSSPS